MSVDSEEQSYVPLSPLSELLGSLGHCCGLGVHHSLACRAALVTCCPPSSPSESYARTVQRRGAGSRQGAESLRKWLHACMTLL